MTNKLLKILKENIINTIIILACVGIIFIIGYFLLRIPTNTTTINYIELKDKIETYIQTTNQLLIKLDNNISDLKSINIDFYNKAENFFESSEAILDTIHKLNITMKDTLNKESDYISNLEDLLDLNYGD